MAAPGNYRNPYLCLTIVWFLGVISVVSLLGIIALGFVGKETPSSLVSIASGSLCALTAFLVQPPRHSVGYDDPLPAVRQPHAPEPLVVSPNQPAPMLEGRRPEQPESKAKP